MCDVCIKKLEAAFVFVQKIRKLEENYFVHARSSESEDKDEKYDDLEEVQAVDRSPSRLAAVSFRKKKGKKFAETWMALKQVSGDEEDHQCKEKLPAEGFTRKTHQPRLKPSKNAVPHIKAPETCPMPPSNWLELGKISHESTADEIFTSHQVQSENYYEDYYSYFQMGMTHCQTPLTSTVFVPLQVSRNAVKAAKILTQK